ncbi:MAG: hypothetical protein IT580_13040 [Verrucomicrobiales bacterium]|nr:hypothetical protein [Verrucomicrobiales bacterium]
MPILTTVATPRTTAGGSAGAGAGPGFGAEGVDRGGNGWEGLATAARWAFLVLAVLGVAMMARVIAERIPSLEGVAELLA